MKKEPDQSDSSKGREQISSGPFSFHDILAPDRTFILEKADKKEVLEILIDSLAKSTGIKNRQELADGIYYRENLMSTGIGLGAAVPHVRLDSVKKMIMAIALCKSDITNYDAIDSAPVRMVFMIVAAKDQHAMHIRALSAIAYRIKNGDLRKSILACSSPEEFYKLMTI